jgi:hypothetical protein
MIAHLSSLTADPLGSVWLDLLPESAIYKADRRINRVKTLDGGYVLNDFGFAHCDRDAVLYWRSDDTIDFLVRRLLEVYGRVHLAIAEGVFLVALRDFDASKNRSMARLHLLEKLTT